MFVENEEKKRRLQIAEAQQRLAQQKLNDPTATKNTAAQTNYLDQQNRASKVAQGLGTQFDKFGTPTNQGEADNFTRALQAYAPQGFKFLFEPAQKPGRFWGTNNDFETPGVVHVQDPKGKEFSIDLSKPDQVKQYIHKISGLDIK